jgi:hypothetical protein
MTAYISLGGNTTRQCIYVRNMLSLNSKRKTYVEWHEWGPSEQIDINLQNTMGI